MSVQHSELYSSVLLHKKNKREAACLLKSTCSSLKEAKLKRSNVPIDSDADTDFSEKLKCIEDLMWTLLNPALVDNYQNIEWCKWFIAGGDFPEEFAKKVRDYDDAVLCGLVWTPSFVAYRCRTCSLTPSMSLCADCFLSGDHEGHDFNMFRSQAGGACDCGDVQVMRETGFCIRHGLNARKNKPKPPPDLTCVAEFIFPHIFRRILLHFREKFLLNNNLDQNFAGVEKLIDFLQINSDYGAAMKQTICTILLDKEIYRKLFYDKTTTVASIAKVLFESQLCYEHALKSLENICTKEEAEILDCPDLCPDLKHETLLDEFVFWLVRLEFPQKLVTFVLSLLPCENYKQLLLDSFALHYTRIAEILARPESANEIISHRVIHISVQLLSSDVLATNLVKHHKFLRVLVASLYTMVKRCLIECTLHTRKDNFHQVADCRNRIMEGHNYWVLASDLHNLINHGEITLQFLRDPVLLDLWCDMISILQGMNVNVRELVNHVQFESRSYYPAFTAEIEICASTTWHLLQHLKDNSSYDCILVMLQNATCQIQEWFEAIQFKPHSCWKPPLLECCFHLPLHRLYASFLCQGIKLGMQIPFPSETFLRQLVMHPLTIQVSRSEINCNMWVRNGSSMRYQACLYVQSHFSCSFSDLDVYLLQVCATKINPDWFVLTVFERFHLVDWLSFSPIQPVKPFLRPEWEMPMLEGALRLIATMITNTVNLGLTEEECTTLEIATLLCQGDRTHSQIIDLLPDKGSHSWPKNFEQILHELADYKAPQFEPGGAMSEGIYVPKNVVWQKYFDPLFVMLRSFQIKEFQTSMDRYSEYLKKNNLWHGEKSFWPPYAMPTRNFASYEGLKRLLHCRSLHSVIFDVLFKAVSEAYPVSDDALCLSIYLLELALRFPAQGPAISETSFANRHTVIDLQFCGWFPGNCIFTNLCHKIDRVLYIDNIPGLSRSCQDETNQGDFPDLIRLRAKLAGSTLTPTSENALVPSDLPRSRSADIPYIDSMEVESDGESDYFYNKAMAFLPPRLRRQYFLTSTDRPALTMDGDDCQASTSSDAMALLVVGSREMTVHKDDTMDFTNDDQPALQHNQRLAIESGDAFQLSEEASVVLRQPGTMTLTAHGLVISDDENELGLPTNDGQKQLPEGQQPPHALPQPKVYVTNVGESMLSLLIKLYNKLNTSSTYKPPVNDQLGDDCRVGDGPFFIKKTLDRAYFDSELCRRTIDDLCRTSTAPNESPAKKDNAKENRKKAAKERQQRLMAQFTSKQKAVFEQFVQKESNDADVAAASATENVTRTSSTEKVFECVICNSMASLSVDQPIGLVAHSQATSVLAKSYTDNFEYRDLLNTVDDESASIYSRATFEKKFYDRLSKKFDKIFTLASTNFGWEGGVYVQTCGHYVHCECQEMYMKAIRTDASQMQNSYLQVDKGEFYCPLCRQFSNCVLPLIPDIVEKSFVRSNVEMNFDRSCEELMRLLEEPNESSITQTELEKRSNKFIVHLVHSTYPQFTRNVEDFEAIWAFLCSVLRTNLEIFSLLSVENLLQKRSSCISELMKLLANQVASLEPTELRHQLEWSRMTGVVVDLQSDAIANKDNETPLLFHDPVSLLIRLTFLLTQNSSDPKHYSILFSIIFTLNLFQICLREIRTLDEEILQKFSSIGRTTAETVVEMKTIRSLWTFVCQQFAFDKTNHDSSQPETSAGVEFRQMNTFFDSIISKFGLDGSGRKILSADPSNVRSKTSFESSGGRPKTSFESSGGRKSFGSESSKKSSSDVNNLGKIRSDSTKRAEGSKSSSGFESTPFRKLFGHNIEKFTPNSEPIEVDESENKKVDETNILSGVDVDEIWPSIETKLISLSLPFLRNAVVLKQSAYSSWSTTIGGGEFWSDARSLINYIQDKSGDLGEEDFFKLSFYSPNGANAIKRWVDDVRLSCKNDYKEIIDTTYRAISWKTPRLLRLPDNFDIVFRKFHQAPCQKCGRTPKEMLLCLTCGRTICYRDTCCKSGNLTEIETHTIDCGAGTGVYISVHSSLVIIVREKRFSHWGSLYLDAHGEEDRGLKRGKTLFLSAERLALLEKQWLSHNFDGTCKRWNWLNQNPNVGNVIIL